MKSVEDDLLQRIARGLLIEQDEYDQLWQDLPPAELARALAKRHAHTSETQSLVEAARLYAHAGFLYEALEVCSRAPRVPELRKITRKCSPANPAGLPADPAGGQTAGRGLHCD